MPFQPAFLRPDRAGWTHEEASVLLFDHLVSESLKEGQENPGITLLEHDAQYAFLLFFLLFSFHTRSFFVLVFFLSVSLN